MTREELEKLVEAHQTELFRYLRFIGTVYSVATIPAEITGHRFVRLKVAP